jgi:hypothetical protein
VLHPFVAPVLLLGAFTITIPAIESVLGGASNSIAVGLVAGTLVAVLVWQIGSAAVDRRFRGSPQGIS